MVDKFDLDKEESNKIIKNVNHEIKKMLDHQLRGNLKTEIKKSEEERYSLLSELDIIRESIEEIQLEIKKERKSMLESKAIVNEIKIIKNKMKLQITDCIKEYVINGSIKDTIRNIMTVKKKEDKMSCSIVFYLEK